MNKIFCSVLLLYVLSVALLLAVIPADFLKENVESEAVKVQDYMGEQEYNFISEKATDWFKSGVVESGLLATIYSVLMPTESQIENSEGFEGLSDQWGGFVESRMEAIQILIYHVLLRSALLFNWMPFMLLLAVPAFYSGYNERQIKKTNFEYSSPFIHGMSLKAALVIVVGLVIIMFMPIAFNPIYLPALMMLFCVVLGISLGHFQKRI